MRHTFFRLPEVIRKTLSGVREKREFERRLAYLRYSPKENQKRDYAFRNAPVPQSFLGKRFEQRFPRRICAAKLQFPLQIRAIRRRLLRTRCMKQCLLSMPCPSIPCSSPACRSKHRSLPVLPVQTAYNGSLRPPFPLMPLHRQARRTT